MFGGGGMPSWRAERSENDTSMVASDSSRESERRHSERARAALDEMHKLEEIGKEREHKGIPHAHVMRAKTAF
jgi:hypothetical protein